MCSVATIQEEKERLHNEDFFSHDTMRAQEKRNKKRFMIKAYKRKA